MRVLVTGATGNVGTALLRALTTDTDVEEVVGVASRLPDDGVEPYLGVRWVRADLSDPGCIPVLSAAARGCDVVVHLAWRLQPSGDLPAMRRVNLGGVRAVVQACVDAGVPDLVHVSSIGAYSAGPKDRFVDEGWPTGGIHTSAYSRDKAAAERFLDSVTAAGAPLQVTRVRPAIVPQASAGSEVARYFLGPLVSRSVLGRLRLPVLPIPPELVFQVVHSDDLAQALRLAAHARLGLAVNVAADPPLTPDDIARAMGAGRSVPFPKEVLRSLVDVSWHLRLQRTDPGWLDMGLNTPLISSERARTLLGWQPKTDPVKAFSDLVAGMRTGAGVSGSPPLTPS